MPVFNRKNTIRLCVFILINLFITCSTTHIKYDYKYIPQHSKVTIMFITAHPDDEGIFFGGSLPYYSQTLKVPVLLLNMTTNWLNHDGTQNQASFSREAELRRAAWQYGLMNEPVFALFQQNNRFWSINKSWDRWADNKLNGNDIAEGMKRSSLYLAEQIRLYKPDVVVTHGINGEYGNPDHKALAYATIAAYGLAAGKKVYLDDGENEKVLISPVSIVGDLWQTQKLYLHYSEPVLKHESLLFHDYWEDQSIEGSSPREIANMALLSHKSQGKHFVSSLYDNKGRTEFSNHPSELWTLVKSEVGPDPIIANFKFNSNFHKRDFNNWSKGNFLVNLYQ